MKYEVIVGVEDKEFTIAVDSGDGDELTAAFRAGIILAGEDAPEARVITVRSEEEFGYR